MTYSLEQACRDFSALDAHTRGDHNAMRGVGNPLVDQIRAAIEPYMIGQRQPLLSPSAREYPRISDGLDRAHAVGMDIRTGAPEGIDAGAFLRKRLRNLEKGGQPVGVAVVHCRELTYDDHGSTPASRAHIVPIGWSYEEFAHSIAHSTWACWLCDRGQNYDCESFLLVSCGAVIHVLSSCRRCRGELNYKGLDWSDRFPRCEAR
ncbi:hypothetical protein [Rhodococcus aetherivorans]|uniref:hypothetical protein n=1 Tax=Rhodococcus aetherivorans TaxID=191292 RepID=UPI001E3CDD38|nr:hypothetical protein [Rhodococcus aetherivorans]UGQ39895.1 hypothetical protein LRQ66_17085 [Rhodococcus aetherivorans]